MPTKTELKSALLKCYETGHLTNDFATMVLDVARGHITKNHWRSTYASRQDYLSGFSLRLVKKWKCINPELNIQSYLSGMTNFAARDVMKRQKRHSGKLKMFNQIITFYHPYHTNAEKRQYLGAVCC